MSDYRGKAGGQFSQQPAGIILHGSRGGAADLATEYLGTVRWATSNPQGLGWNATIGPESYAVHLDARHWGWNAREHSRYYLAVEFAQPAVDWPIDDRQVAAFVAWARRTVAPVWPGLLAGGMLTLVGHSELAAGIRDGKTDPYPRNDARLVDLKRRLRAALQEPAPPEPVDEDALLEAAWVIGQSRLGEKRFAARLDRAEWGGTALVCRAGVLVVHDGRAFDETARVIDDWVTAGEADGTLTRY